MILMSVQMAATAMTPAPMKRTSDLNTVDRAEVRSSAPSSWPFAYRGSRTPYEVIMPISIAIPTVIPTRWPTPIRARDREVEIIVPVEPILKAVPTSEATTFM